MNFNEIFGKNVAYDDLTSHKKTGFRPLFRKRIFGRPVGRVGVGLGRSVVGVNHRIFVFIYQYLSIFSSQTTTESICSISKELLIEENLS